MKKLLSLLTLLPIATYALDAPVVSITCEQVSDSVEVTLTWEEIPEATQYYIFNKGVAPYGVGELVGSVEQSPYIFRTVDHQFFYVVAEDTPGPPPGFTLIPAGTFMMGSDDGNPDEQPIHQVILTHNFYLGTHEVTNAEYCEALNWALAQGILEQADGSTVRDHGQELLDVNDSSCEIDWNGSSYQVGIVVYGDYAGQSADDHPVKEVSWCGAACYCDWLSLIGGVGAFYNGDWDQSAGHNPYTSLAYRLPTEAEWEYAAQYNDDRTYPWGDETPDCDYANFYILGWCVNWTSPVGSCPTGNNHLGLQDMAGNLFEWVGDRYGNYSGDSQEDPLGSAYGSDRIVRGGSWYDFSYYLRCAYRIYGSPYDTYSNVGFRAARTTTSD